MLEEFLERLRRGQTIARQPAGSAPLTICSIPGGGRAYAGATTQAKLWLLCDFGQVVGAKGAVRHGAR